MEIPLRNIKGRLYKGKLKKYFEAGRQYEDYSESRLEEIASDLSPFTRKYFKESLQQQNIKAYHDVQGQLTLIDTDIFGLIPNAYQEHDLECAFDVGQFFYNIKLIDFFLDNKLDIPLEKRAELLDSAERVLLGKELDLTQNTEFNYILEILSLNPRLEIGDIYKNLKSNVIKSLQSIPDKERLKSTINIGTDMGQIMYEIMNENYIMPDWSKEFLMQQGRAANIFDDIKDFSKDRKRNQGYSISFLPSLFLNFWYHFYKTNEKLPTRKELKDFYTFMFLGSIFQLEELFHLKSR